MIVLEVIVGLVIVQMIFKKVVVGWFDYQIIVYFENQNY